ncbi:hypothetical protein OS493_020920 [Desmophyllum pertusum]|uniref:Uncharacterized protein n=1 Tax=Desmophyllum pertusum TaxID=174260 RepID=A0A9X0D8N6_9CNID|nr:hypothetical protein OS493_020920 [Desmophyllum pertusum]
MVRNAKELLMKRHPMLRMCTKKNQDGDYFLQKISNVNVDLYANVIPEIGRLGLGTDMEESWRNLTEKMVPFGGVGNTVHNTWIPCVHDQQNVTWKRQSFTKKHGVEIQRNPLIQPRNKMVPVEFTKVETSSFLKKCKHTAAGVAMVTMLEEQQCEVDSYVTVNVRPFLKSKVPDHHAGAYCQGLQCKNMIVSSADAVQFWSMARQAFGNIHASLNKNELNT